MNDNIALDKQFQPCYYKPIDKRIEVDNESDIMNIKQPYVGMNVYCSSNGKTYQITGISINDKLSTVTSYAENTNPSDKAKLDKIPAYADKFVSFEYAYEGSNLDFKLKYIYNSYNEILGSFANTTRSLIIPISDGNVPSGLMSKSDKNRLDSLPDKPSVITDFVTELNNIEQSATLHLKYTDVDGEHDLEAYIDAATTTWPGLMSTSDKNKLNGIPAGAIDLTSVQTFRDSSSYTFRLNYTDKDGSHYENLTVPYATVDYAGLLTPGDRAVIYGNVERINDLEERIAALKSFDIVSVDVLPTASASTMNKLYLVPAEDSETTNIKDEYITIQSTGGYSWEAIGKTSIDLSNYVQKRAGYDLSQNDFTNAYKSILDNLSTNYQAKLVSGTNIKTINGQSLLGSGNIVISAGGTYSPGNGISINSSNVISANIDSETMEFKSGTIKSKTGFKSVIVGSSTIAANGVNSINLVAGSNITLSTDVLTNTITISSSGGGGGSYTPGTGINISNNTISVDTSVIATKSDINSKISNGFAQINVNDIASLYANGESTFKLAAGANIQFAVNSATNTITISSSGGGGGSVGVVDSLTSTSTTDALSANQGRVLKGLIDNSEYAFIKSFTLNNVEASWIAGTARRLQIQTVFSGTTQGIHAELANNGVLQLGLEKATDSTPGGVIVDGTTITANNGVISANLPTIVDDLTSTSSTSVLSAKQGKVLKDLIDGINAANIVKFTKIVNQLPTEISPTWYINWQGNKIKQQVTEVNGTIYLNAAPPSTLSISKFVDRMQLMTSAGSPQYWYLVAWDSHNPSERYWEVFSADNVWVTEGTGTVEHLNPSFESDIQNGDILFLTNAQTGYTANKFYTAVVIPQLTSITYDNETTPDNNTLYICKFDNNIYHYNGITLISLGGLSQTYIDILNSLANGFVSKITVGSTILNNNVKLVAGSNVTLTPNASNGTIIISSSGGGGGGGISNSFATVKVGSTQINSTGEDTLELFAGNNITLTPDSSGKKVTIASTGGSGYAMASVTLQKSESIHTYTQSEFNNIGFNATILQQIHNGWVRFLKDSSTNEICHISKTYGSAFDLINFSYDNDNDVNIKFWRINDVNRTVEYRECVCKNQKTIGFLKPSSDLSDVDINTISSALDIPPSAVESIFIANSIMCVDGNDIWELNFLGCRKKISGNDVIKIERYFGMQMYSSYQYQVRFVKELNGSSWVYSVKFKSV